MVPLCSGRQNLKSEVSAKRPHLLENVDGSDDFLGTD